MPSFSSFADRMSDFDTGHGLLALDAPIVKILGFLEGNNTFFKRESPLELCGGSYLNKASASNFENEEYAHFFKRYYQRHHVQNSRMCCGLWGQR
ncbi:hypothetical protein RB195_020442 [Necator americanus]|uniref:Uncharacterized protein n=1 Tax=Necator americanus TaxID=51031 RepID=A0ABR1CKB4_NECAM